LYNPRWFKEDRVDILQDTINRISFGTIITMGNSGILASHVPMLIDKSRGERGTLFGHIARGNMQWRESSPENQGLAVFLGPDAYISPNWYETKTETGKTVPTWNYIAIHVRGPVRFFEETERIRDIVTKLTNHHEADSTEPWQVTDAPADYINKELKMIIGFEMPIVKIEGKWKMSQNRSQTDRDSVMSNLVERNRLKDREVAHEMNIRRTEADF
jgi:transcriptional regulator